jgi:hypothetical protein
MTGLLRYTFVFLALCMSVAITSQPSFAYRDYFTPEQRELLPKIQKVLVEIIALTDKGPADTKPFVDIVSRRLEEMGYTIVTDPSQPNDVVFRVKCEEHRVWEGTATAGGDADLADAPARLWKGPACQFNYFLGGAKIKWQKEVRTDFQDAAQAALSANAGEPGAYAMRKLQDRLKEYDFPVIITAEWGQADRLAKVLESGQTNQFRKLKIVSMMGEMVNDSTLPPEAVATLKNALKDKDLAKQAAVALGNLSPESIPFLIDLLRTTKEPEVQAAAAKGLGQIGALQGDSRIVPPLLEVLQAPNTDVTVLTEVAWALGKLPDKRSAEPLYALDRKLRLTARDRDDPKIKKLLEAVFWAIKQVDTWDQFS